MSEDNTGKMPDLVAELIRAAGRRRDPPAAAYERTLAAAASVWRAKLRRRRLRLLFTTAIAAAAAGIAVLLVAPPDAPPPVVALMDRSAGGVEMTTAAGGWTAATGSVTAGSTLRTDAVGRAGLRLPDGTSLRLGEASEIVLESAARIELLSGRLYVDTGPQGRSSGRRLEVVTQAGTAVDRGTQFEVLYRDDNYRLRVREGSVTLLGDNVAANTGVGEELRIDAARIVSRAQVARDDPDWRWAESVAPAPEVDGRPLTMLLAWVARETGREIRYASAETEREAQAVILHGRVQNLAPMDVLAALLATTDLRHRLADDGTILIEPKPRL